MRVRRPLSPLLTLVVASATLAACSSTEDPTDSASAGQQRTAVGRPTEALEGSAVLVMHPQLAHTGRRPESADRALSSMTARFAPASEGRKVTLQRKDAGGWQSVGTGTQNRNGAVEFTALHQLRGETQTYRVFAPGSDGFAAVTSNPADTGKWGRPDFNDDFAGDSLGPAWSHRLQGYQPDSMRACSKADPGAVRVSGGTARLDVVADPLREGRTCATDEGSFDYRWNGHISTEGQHAFTYGYFAARIRFQQRRGQHGAFWMVPQSQAAPTGSARDTGAEIDVIEWFGEGHARGGLLSFVYSLPYTDGKRYGGYVKNPEQYGDDWAQKYHVFSVEWTPKHYVFRIDGRQTFRTTRAISGRPQFMILSLLSSDYELPRLGKETNLPQTMSVDWVRHWSL